jgi:hypothetical protein
LINTCESLIRTFRRRSGSVSRINGDLPPKSLQEMFNKITRSNICLIFHSPNNFAIFLNNICVVLIHALIQTKFKSWLSWDKIKNADYFADNIKYFAKEWNRCGTWNSKTYKYIIGTEIVTTIRIIKLSIIGKQYSHIISKDNYEYKQ